MRMIWSRTQLTAPGIATALWLAVMPTISHAQTGHDAFGVPQKDSIAPDQQEFLDGIDKIVAHRNFQDIQYIAKSLGMKYNVEAFTFNQIFHFDFHFYTNKPKPYADLALLFPRSGTIMETRPLADNYQARLELAPPTDGCIPLSHFDGWSSQGSYRYMGQHAPTYNFVYGSKQTDPTHATRLVINSNEQMKCTFGVIFEEYTTEQK